MKKSWKKLAISSGIALLLSGALTPSLIVKADTTEQKSSPVEVQNDSNLSAEFDLSKLPLNGETKSVTDSQGNVTYFKVESGSNPMARISNGSHKVTAWDAAWHVSFYITTSGNKITSARDLNYTIVGAQVNSASLRVDNSKRASAHFSFTTPIWNVISWTGWVRATINSSNNLVVTRN